MAPLSLLLFCVWTRDWSLVQPLHYVMSQCSEVFCYWCGFGQQPQLHLEANVPVDYSSSDSTTYVYQGFLSEIVTVEVHFYVAKFSVDSTTEWRVTLRTLRHQMEILCNNN